MTTTAIGCETELYQFVCGRAVNWRPVFKLNDNVKDYGGQSNAYDYYAYGTPTYSSYTNDIAFVLNTFDAFSTDASNYRSLMIDDWTNKLNNGEFSQVKISLYLNDIEIRYFVFNATSNYLDWVSQETYIDSSWIDVGYESYNYFDLYGEITYERRFMIWCVLLLVFFICVFYCKLYT